MASLFEPSRRQRTRLKSPKSVFEPEEDEEGGGLFPGGDVDQKDRGDHRAGLPEKPLSELPGYVGNMAMMAFGGPPSWMGNAASYATTGKSIMGNLGDWMGFGGKEPSIAEIMTGNTSANSNSTRSADDPDGIGIGGGMGPSMADLNAATSAAAAAEMDPNSFMFRGGKVKKPASESLFADVDPPGPDDVLIAAKTGERILNEAQYASLSKEAKAEVDAALKAKAKRK